MACLLILYKYGQRAYASELITVRCIVEGMGTITLKFDYPLFVGTGKLFSNGTLWIRQKKSSQIIHEVMLETGFSVN